MVMLSSKTGLDASRVTPPTTPLRPRVTSDAWLGPGAWSDGIRVNAVRPGNVFEAPRSGTPEYIKAAAKKMGIQPEEVIPITLR